MRKLFTAALLMVAAVAVAQNGEQIAVSDSVARPVFREISRPTPNFDADKVNEAKDAMDKVKGAVDEKVNQAKDVVDKANDVKDAVGGLLGR